MIKTARKPSIQILETGEIVSVVSEACGDSIPSFVAIDQFEYERFLLEDPLILGERAVFFRTTQEGVFSKAATPVLVRGRDSEQGPNPQRCMVLKDCVAPVIRRNPKTGGLYVFWWWNAWSPDLTKDLAAEEAAEEDAEEAEEAEKGVLLLKPSREFYRSHICPSEEHLAAPGALTPNINPGKFDVNKPFFVNPLFDRHSVDLFPLVSSTVDKTGFDLDKLKESPGVLWLRMAIFRGLFRINVPAIPTRLLGELSAERLLWEQTGGIRALNQHIRTAISYNGKPVFLSEPKKSFINAEKELAEYPDVEERISSRCTWEDHRIIVNSVLAHSSIVGLSKTTRVLMYSRASLYNNMSLVSIPKDFKPANPGDYGVPLLKWPLDAEIVSRVPLLVLDPPNPVSAHPYSHNQQQLVNADYILPYLYNGVGSAAFLGTDGRVSVGSTEQVRSQPEIDWLFGDPIDPLADMMGFFSAEDSLDIRSY